MAPPPDNRRANAAAALAVVALAIAVAGAGYAAVALPRDSVGTAQIRAGAVTSTKVRNHSLLAVDFRKGQLPRGPRGDEGPAGPVGATGPTGAQGPAGPAGATGPEGPAGATGARGATGATGATGAVGPTWGTMWEANSGGVASCVPSDLLSRNITLEQPSRLYVSAMAQVSAASTADMQLSVDVLSGGGTMGAVDTGAAMTAPVVPTLMTLTGIISDIGGVVDLPAGSYQVRFRLAETAPCTVAITATAPTLSVVTLGVAQ